MMEKMKNKKTLKAVVLSLGLAGMLWSAGAFAQGGLFRPGDPEPSRSLLNRSGGSAQEDITLQNFGENQDGITLQNFGEEAPLGSGWLVLMGAGLGYAALKQKKNNKKQTK